MYTVKIYADDPSTKNGKRKINRNTRAGSELVESFERVAETLEALKPESRMKINKIVIERETAADGTIDLTFEPKAKANGETTKPALRRSR